MEEVELAEDESPLFDGEHGLAEHVDRRGVLVAGARLFDPGSAIEVHVPPAGTGVFAELLRADGSRSELRVETHDGGAVELVTADEVAASAAAAVSPPGECEDRARNLAPWRWEVPFEWSFNSASRPTHLDRARTESALRRAANNIVRTDNNCGLADLVSATHTYLGRTTRAAGVGANGACLESDGHNVVSFGDLPEGTLGVTCTWYLLTGEAIESDVVLNSGEHAWTLELGSSCRDRFHVEAIMTHELGHVFGLGHVAEAEHGRLTMSTRASPCQASETTLGRGDLIGLRRKY